jgi:hypothetical protein
MLFRVELRFDPGNLSAVQLIASVERSVLRRGADGGDLYHHPVEVERTEWGIHWADAAATARSLALLTTAALAEDALLVAAHIAGSGRLRRTLAGLRWAVVTGLHAEARS